MTQLVYYVIDQRKVGNKKWWRWPYTSYFKQRIVGVAKRLRAAADGRYEYRIKKVVK